MPKEGISRNEYRIKNFGSWERSQQLDANIAVVGQAEGIHFAFDINDKYTLSGAQQPDMFVEAFRQVVDLK